MAFNFYEWSLRAYLNLKTRRTGKLVGTDPLGNEYYVDRTFDPGKGSRYQKRWVVFKGESDASRVPAEWHGWLHHQTDRFPSADNPFRQPWVKDHAPNLTGTPQAYRPPGAVEQGGRRSRATGDYQPWSPGQEGPAMPATPARTETRLDGRLADRGDAFGFTDPTLPKS